jgi:hypothetical protein
MVSIFSDIASSIHCIGEGYDHHHQVESHMPADETALPHSPKFRDAPTARQFAFEIFNIFIGEPHHDDQVAPH